ncbi:MAG: DedA family protein [Chromatiales bacterium]|nr:DedA family protein [Chromatiales bacterium]
MSDLTLWAVFASSFLAATLLPGGSEAVLGYSALQSDDTLLLWGLATLGNTLGGLTSWGIGWWLNRRYPAKTLTKAAHLRALERLQQHGSPLLLLSWVPVIGDPLCLAAGWAGIRFLPSVIFIAIGKGARYALLLTLLPGVA